ncbi:MAG TPA: type III-B CRISPR module-associated protein Cmr5 [Terriglobales bacterium]|nr:type III-B CRISPR module-associated protein Cmr5 [Terriglobales bacterium]
MESPEGKPGVLRSDQRRALLAYQAVGAVPAAGRKDYKIAVNDLGANILRSGLCAALAALQRREGSGEVLLEHLAGAGIPGLRDVAWNVLARRVQEIDAGAYMIATREMLQVAMWLKRAAQATFGDE